MAKFLHHVSLVIALMGATAAYAAEPAAVVEGVSAARTDIQELDFLEAGRTFELAADEVMTLVYLTSCLQETITGGVVTIGLEQSSVAGGVVKRKNVNCDSDAVVSG